MQIRFQDFVESDGRRLAVVGPDGSCWTRQQLADDVNAMSRALRARGLGVGSVMVIAAPNGAEFLGAYLAATQIGMYVVPLNWHLSASEIRYIIQDSSASVLVVHERFEVVLTAALKGMPTPLGTRISIGRRMPGYLTVQELIVGYETARLEGPVAGRVLSYTSATTGRPKGVVLPIGDAERALDLSISMRILAGTLPEEHVQLCASMLYHGAPLEGVVVALHLGHIVVLLDVPDAEQVLRSIHEHGVTMAYIVPSMFPKLLKLDERVRRSYSTGSLRKVLHAGAPCPIEVKRKMIEWWGPIFLEAYGATEGAGTIASSQDWLKHPGTVGKPMQGTKLRIIGSDGLNVPPGVIGLIYMTRYSGEDFEYLNDPAKTRAAHLGEFFTVGDLGFLTEDGYLFLCDRAIDVINRSGTKIYPAELEGLILEVAGVCDCAVIGVPDAKFGEAVVAAVQPANPEASFTDIRRQIVKHLSERLSIFKIPTKFVAVDRLPRDASGKAQKRLLRDQWAKDQSAIGRVMTADGIFAIDARQDARTAKES